MRRRLFIAALLALAAGAALAYATYRYVQQAPVQTVAAPTQPVVVAAADLAVGTALAPDDVRVVRWPAGAVPAGTFATVQEVVGRGLVAPVVRHEPILAAKLAAKEAGAGLPPVIPPGLRAVSVRVNEVIGVAGYVLPGTRVDVVATASPSASPADVTS
jgi:pilus assembly protein CpaB